MGSYRGPWVVGTEPLEEELDAGARRRVQLAGELVVVAFASAPAGRRPPKRHFLILHGRRRVDADLH